VAASSRFSHRCFALRLVRRAETGRLQAAGGRRANAKPRQHGGSTFVSQRHPCRGMLDGDKGVAATTRWRV